MVADARLFIQLSVLSMMGLLFYYAHLLFGVLQNVVLYKSMAVVFLLATIPLPIIALNNRKLFPELTVQGRTVLGIATALLLFHHFLMTFIFLLFLRTEGMH